jgi:transposase
LKAEEALELSEAQLQAKLFLPKAPPKSDRPQPAWAEVHRQLRQNGMTRLLLWQEYPARHPEGFGTSQFKHHYNRYQSTLNHSMRQLHYAGDKCFVDFSGLTVPLVDPVSGKIRKAQIFVAVLGASGYTFVHAVEDQSTEAFIRCHVEAFAFYGGVPNQIVCDNLKAAV